MLPFTVQRIDHVVFRVQDLGKSVAFYKEVLGCEVVRERHDLGLIHVRAGTSMIDLVSVTGPLGSPGGSGPREQGRNVDHLCMRVEPFNEEEILAHLAHCGAPARGRATENFGAEGMGPSIYFQDPDGNVIELKGPVDPGGQWRAE